ncbi:MAG: cache domain-containing protein [Desulfobacteraceae bacterium]|jgi:signal transduction histidine kinase
MPGSPPLDPSNNDHRMPWGAPLNIVLPVLITLALFVITLFWLLLPRLELHLMDRKREMIRELTESAWSAVRYYHSLAEKGVITDQEARRQALDLLRNIRFGPKGKDYFWINDMRPVLIMHPYRPDLEGRDASEMTDSTGKRLFMDFVDTVRRKGAGYVDYRWQWQDNPDKIVSKISYVKGFTPWGWVIGTGVYVEDVRAQISAITQNITSICLGITAVMFLLCFYIIWQGAAAERKRTYAEEQARLQREQLYQSAKMASLGTLVAGVAHEINNPISTVLLNIQTLEKFWQRAAPVLDRYHQSEGGLSVGNMDYAELAARMPELIRHTLEGIMRVGRIVGDLKEFSGQRPSEFEDMVDLNSVVRKSIGLTGTMIKKASSEFQATYAEHIPTFQGNAQRLEQVIINLLVNACQAMAEKRMPLRVATGYDASSRTVVVEVEDGGCGMAPDVIDRITDPFFTTKRDSGGTGLGLSISDTIIREHGGRLEFRSTPGAGTVATVRIPIRTPEPQNAKLFS